MQPTFILPLFPKRLKWRQAWHMTTRFTLPQIPSGWLAQIKDLDKVRLVTNDNSYAKTLGLETAETWRIPFKHIETNRLYAHKRSDNERVKKQNNTRLI